MKLAQRSITMETSPIRKLLPFAEAAKKQGKKIYHLNIGQPDIITPRVFFEAISNYKEKTLAYAVSAGLPELINAIIKYYRDRFAIEYTTKEVLITNGGSEGVAYALATIADYGDEVLSPEPFYANYKFIAHPYGVKIRGIPTHAEDGFALPSAEEISKLVTHKTRGILLANPSNPTGTVFGKKELSILAKVAKKHDLFIISDEAYREFVYDGDPYLSFGCMKEIEDRVIILDSISKRYSACGARIGSIASKNALVMEGLMKLCQARLAAPTLEMLGAAALYNVEEAYLRDVNVEYKKRRDLMYTRLKQIPGLVCEKPKGAFYLIAKLPIDDAEKFVRWMLEEFSYNNETVMVTPAENFYETPGKGRDEVRIAYVLNCDDLERACNCLAKGLEAYPGRRK